MEDYHAKFKDYLTMDTLHFYHLFLDKRRVVDGKYARLNNLREFIG